MELRFLRLSGCGSRDIYILFAGALRLLGWAARGIGIGIGGLERFPYGCLGETQRNLEIVVIV